MTETPDGSALLVVHSTRGELHRVDTDTGQTQVVDLGGASLVARWLYLPNARFSTPPMPVTEYWVTQVPRH